MLAKESKFQQQHNFHFFEKKTTKNYNIFNGNTQEQLIYIIQIISKSIEFELCDMKLAILKVFIK